MSGKRKNRFNGEDCEPSLESMCAELIENGWKAVTIKVWKAPAGSGCAGYFLGPCGAWKAMKRAGKQTQT